MAAVALMFVESVKMVKFWCSIFLLQAVNINFLTNSRTISSEIMLLHPSAFYSCAYKYYIWTLFTS